MKDKNIDWSNLKRGFISTVLKLELLLILRAVPEIILRGGWAADTFLSCGGEGVLLTVCPRGGEVGSNLSWGSRHI